MPLTKQQKSESIDKASKKLAESQSAVFAEFSGVSVEDFKNLRRGLKKAGADVKILKKRLLNIALKNAGVEFDPSSATKNQMGAIFSKGELQEIAGLVHKFSKDLAKKKKGEFSVMAAYDFGEKRFVDAKEFTTLATLPSREVLLAQVAMMLTMPLKQVMTALNERSKQVQ